MEHSQRSVVSLELFHQMQVEKRNLENVSTNLIAQAQTNNSVIERLNSDNLEKSRQNDILRESLQRAEAIIKKFQLDADKSCGMNISLETQIAQLHRQVRHLEQVNLSLSKYRQDNEDLVMQNDRLQQKLIDAKMRIDSLQFEKSSIETKGQSKTSMKKHQLKEADQIIEELTNTLQQREKEMTIALEENDKLMDRYRMLEAELQSSHQTNKSMKGHFDDQILNAENRIKLTQDQAMTQLKQMREVGPGTRSCVKI